MLIIVAGSRWAGKAGRAAGWRAGTFGCGDANQAGGEGERSGINSLGGRPPSHDFLL